MKGIKKILFVATVSGHINAFHLPYIEMMNKKGYIVDIACNILSDIECDINQLYNIKFERSPFTTQHIKSYRLLKEVIDREEYDLITCHTPMASVLCRLASKSARKKGTKVIYTAHGFHFFKGGPVFNWLTYYPIEKYLTKYTDGLICINQPDFDIISAKGSTNCKYFKIPGIGVQEKKYFPIESYNAKVELRIDKGLPKDKILGVYAAEFINRKNHRFILEAFNKERKSLQDFHILFAGKGELEGQLKSLVKEYNLEEYISFIGFRRDLDDVFRCCDFGISASKQEGLPINIVEEMLSGLPVITSIERGHLELVKDDFNGFLFSLDNPKQLTIKLLKLKSRKDSWNILSANARLTGEKYRLENSMIEMDKIFKEFLNGK